MAAKYSCYLSDPFGNRLAIVDTFSTLKYSRVTNAVSTAVLTIPGDFNMNYIIAPDGRMEIWRRLDSGREYLETETTWLIKTVTQSLDARGNTQIVIEADSPLCVLREPGRIINYADGTSQSVKVAAAADDVMKAFIRENIGTSATAARNLSAYISIAQNITQAASVAKTAAWRDLLTTCQELANASTQAGIYLAFDIVAPSQNTLEFRTYTQYRGADHRAPNGMAPLIISPEMGNLGEATFTQGWRDEVTYAIAGGNGNGSARPTQSAQDDTRIALSPFGLRETFVSATNTTTALVGEAQAAVRNGRQKQIFSGKLIDQPDTQYGVQWGWGDFVTAQAFGQSIDCRVDAVSVTVTGGGDYETIDAVLKSDVSS